MNAKEDKADREIEEEMSRILNFRLNMCFSLCAPGMNATWHPLVMVAIAN
jgi:hypothetical protein